MIGRMRVSPVLVLGLCALLLALGGCQTVPVVERPPAALLRDCDVPTPDIRTNLDLAAGYNARGRALKDCNADKAGLRAWYDAVND